jgi:hypothetical protein
LYLAVLRSLFLTLTVIIMLVVMTVFIQDTSSTPILAIAIVLLSPRSLCAPSLVSYSMSISVQKFGAASPIESANYQHQH